uniref:Uncharacterized protein n=1 Tax=Erwinia amylovora ATCC BAA-2158 TaxID=889211 RepID=E5B5D5_ERWAM|nr:hypothetical protein predicted by Glimmer/Critica [Erwinia amylovora ATCC BAA-2158]
MPFYEQSTVNSQEKFITIRYDVGHFFFVSADDRST